MTYKLIKVVSRKNKNDKIYYLAICVLILENDCEIVRILVNEKQAQELQKVIKDTSFDISRYIEVTYNNYQKQYQPTIKYGL